MPVLYIGGEGRSGSTILERLLCSYPGVLGVGELRYLFDRGLFGEELCGCGQPVRRCELWSEVGVRMVGGWDSPATTELAELFSRINDPRRLPELLVGRSRLSRRAADAAGRLLEAVRAVSGASLVVDSSKHPNWAAVLGRSGCVELCVVHLVRHPSAVAYSWSEPKRRPHGGIREAEIPRQPPWQVAIRWTVFNAAFHELRRRGVPTLLLRYEDYVGAIERCVDDCLGVAGYRSETHPDLVLAAGHGIAGNPARFAPPDTAVARDDRWIDGLARTDHLLVSALTGPLRPRYHYRFSRSDPIGREAR